MKFDLDIQFFAGKYVGPEALTELVSKTKEYVNDGLSDKVDKVAGKGLSTEDYTTNEKNKLANVESGAQANVQSDWNATSGDAKILNKPTLATVATSGSYSDLSNKPSIPTVNDATFTVKVEGTSKGTFTANQSSNAEVNITASDLGLSSAMKFIGTTTTQISDGSTTNPITINGSSVTALSGNVVLYDSREYLWNGSLSTPAWEELGDESSHALKTVTITGTGALGGGGSLEANRTITHNAGTAASQSSGLYKFSTDAYSHVASVTAVTKSDITALGIPGEDTNTWRPLGTGASDACAGNDSRLSDARPASDVYSWAKASTKPSYSYSEISGTPSLATVATSGSYSDLSNKPTTSRTLYIYSFTIKASDSGGNDNVNICAYGVSTTDYATTDTKSTAISRWISVFGSSYEVAACGQVRSKWYSSHCDIISARISSTSGTFYYTHIIPYGSASATASMTSTGSRSVSEIYYAQIRKLGSFTV